MAEKQVQQIKALYGEILGTADHLPKNSVHRTVIQLYNGAVDDLNRISDSDYSRFKANQDDLYSDPYYAVSSLKPKMGALLARLEQEFDFHKPNRGEQSAAPMIMTVTNNNQLNVTIVPIQEILQNITDEDLRADVEELKAIVQGSKDKRRASNLLNSIQQKSWDVFIALLPVVLEHLGRQQN